MMVTRKQRTDPSPETITQLELFIRSAAVKPAQLAVRTALLLRSIGSTDPSIPAGTTTVKLAHVSELRNGVK